MPPVPVRFVKNKVAVAVPGLFSDALSNAMLKLSVACVRVTSLTLGTPASPGSAVVTLEARGLEENAARDENVAAGTLAARPPAALLYVGGSTAPDTIRAGQTVTLTATIRNNGGSPYRLDPAATRLLVSDNVESAIGFSMTWRYCVLICSSSGL